MGQLRALQGLLWPLAGFAALFLGLALGYTAKGVEDELRLARAEGLCQHSKSWEAFVASEGEDFVCFKQQKFNKRIIKYSIVEETE
jgi:predicted cobalt transporter CbtA